MTPVMCLLLLSSKYHLPILLASITNHILRLGSCPHEPSLYLLSTHIHALNEYHYHITSSVVHLHSSLLFQPDQFNQPFPLSVQYQFITKQAPRGGLQPSLAQRLRKTCFHLLYNIQVYSFIRVTDSRHTLR